MERRVGLEGLAAEVAAIHRENESRDSEIADLRADVKELLALANRSRGGFWAGMAIASGLGSVAGWIATHLASKQG
jgi:hypothetical protein